MRQDEQCLAMSPTYLSISIRIKPRELFPSISKIALYHIKKIEGGVNLPPPLPMKPDARVNMIKIYSLLYI